MAEKDLLFYEESRAIIGSAMEVHNILGHGFFEKIYENALVVEFGLRNIPVLQQSKFPVIYKANNVGLYIPDLMCHSKIIVDTKTIDAITDHEVGKMLNYLKITSMKLGLLINFKHAKLQWKRVAL